MFLAFVLSLVAMAILAVVFAAIDPGPRERRQTPSNIHLETLRSMRIVNTAYLQARQQLHEVARRHRGQ